MVDVSKRRNCTSAINCMKTVSTPRKTAGTTSLDIYLALRSSGPLWNNGQQVSPAHTVGCHCLFLAPADSSCL